MLRRLPLALAFLSLCCSNWVSAAPASSTTSAPESQSSTPPPAGPGTSVATAPASVPASAPEAITQEITQQGVTDISQLSLQDLLNGQVVVATEKATNVRETPGVVTAITRDEIRRSGAHDLMDVLLQVPGFYFATDERGVVSLGMRGIWGGEGRVLVLLDGIEMNDRFYGAVAFGNHFPIDQIQRIEIIRGPGSVVYGQFAEFAVINIVTRQAADLNGVAVTGRYGRMGNGAALGREDLSIEYGQEYQKVPGLSASVGLSLGDAQRSDRTYTDYASARSISQAGNSSQAPLMANVGIAYRDLKLRLLLDDYTLDTADGYGPIVQPTVSEAFRTYAADATYTLHLAAGLTLVPHLDVKRQQSWEVTDLASPLYYDKSATKSLANVTMFYQALSNLDFLVGAEAFADAASIAGPPLGANHYFQNGTATSVHYNDESLFAEGTFTTELGNLTLGVRAENHSEYGHAIIPRAALTKLFERFHFKLLYSTAFRPPTIENIASNPEIQAETTHAYEAESGYQLNDHAALTVNVFNLSVSHPIIEAVNPQNGQIQYSNSSHTGSYGVEGTLLVKYDWGYTNLNASYYDPGALYWSFLPGLNDFSGNKVPSYTTPVDPDVNIAFPALKLALYGSYRVTDDVSVSPSAVWMSRRTWAAAGPTGLVYGYDDPILLVNLYAQYRDVAHIPGLSAGAGIHNLLGANFDFPQGFAGGHAPLPGPTRELFIRVSYEHPL